MPSPEYKDIERLQQLQGMGWETIEGSVEEPAVTGRESFVRRLVR